MATQTIMNLLLKTIGLEKAVEGSKQFYQNMKAGAAAIATAEKAAKSAQYASARRENQDYNSGRGSAGLTGAAGRDFAQQAQGLGGLVRLYATYAANLFAVSAAYTALSRAQDTANMVKGLDQLGAASGVALGTLSKNLVKAMDGAVSLREAMEATVKASSSGMSSKDILRMGEAAKKASQALGVDMSDALSRISRGITKLEPELLDELGIFTRIDPAVQAYAKSVNRSVSSLTQFERQQAFSNAVLAEAEQKFGDINIETNAYTKLLAILKNTATQVGDALNTVLVPIVNILSANPTALYAGIAAMAAMIVRQAIPAFGQFKESLQQTATASQEMAVKRAQDASNASTLITAALQKEQEKRAEALVGEINALEKHAKQVNLRQKDLKAILEDDFATKAAKSDADYADAQTKVNAALSYRNRLEKEYTKAVSEGNTKEAASARRRADAATEIINKVQQQIEAEKKYIEAGKERSNIFMKLTNEAAMKADLNATKNAIISNATYNAGLVGLTGQLRIMTVQMEAAGISTKSFAGGMMLAKAAVYGTASAVMTLAGALNTAFMVVGIFVAAFTVLDGIFDTASKEIANFKDKTSQAESATKTLTDSIEKMYKGNVFSTASMQAQGNATKELAIQLLDLSKSADKALQKLSQSKWNTFWNWVKKATGDDVAQTFNDTFTEQILTGIEQIEKGPVGTKIREDIANLLNVDPKNIRKFNEELQKVKPGSGQAAAIAKFFETASIGASNAASKASEYSASLKKTEEQFQSFANQFIQKDPLTVFATQSIESLVDLATVLEGPIENSMGQVLETLEKLNKVPMFGPEKSAQLASFTTEMREATSEYNNQKIKLEELSKIEATFIQNRERAYNSNNYKETEQSGYTADELNKRIASAKKTMQEAGSKVQQIATTLQKEIPSGINQALDILAKQIGATMAKGATEALQSVYGLVKDIPELAARQDELKLRELGAQAANIKAMQDLQSAIHANTITQAIQNARARLGDAGTQEARRAPIENEIKDLEKIQAVLVKARVNPQEAAKDIKNSFDITSGVFKEYAGTLISATSQFAGAAAELSKISQQEKIIKLTSGPLAIMEAEKQLAEEGVRQTQKYLADNEELLKLQVQRGELSDQERIDAESILRVQKQALESEKTLIELMFMKEKEQIVINALQSLGNSEQVKADIEKIRNLGIGAAYAKLSEDSRARIIGMQKDELETEQAKEKIIQRNLDHQYAMIDIAENMRKSEEGIISLRKEAQRSELEKAKELGKLSEDDYQRAINKLDKDEARKEIASKMQEEDRRYQKEIADLNKQRNAPGTTTEEKAQILERMQAMQRAHLAAKGYIDEELRLRIEAIDKVTDYAINADIYRLENWKSKVAPAFADAIKKALWEGGKEGAQALRQILVDTLKDPINVLIDATVEVFKSGGSANQIEKLGKTITTAVKTYSDIFSGKAGEAFGTSISSGLKSIGTELNAYAMGTANSTAYSIGNTVTKYADSIGAIAGKVSNAFMALNISDAISNGFKTGIDGFVKAATVVGAYLFPGFSAVIGAVAGLVNRAFGRKLADVGVQGTFGGAEGFKGEEYEFYKGGWFRSDKTKTREMDPQLQKAFADQFKGIQLAAITAATMLGGSGDLIKNSIVDFTMDIKFSTKDVTDMDQLNELLATEFDKVSNTMAQGVLRGLIQLDKTFASATTTDEIDYIIKGLMLAEETYSDTLVRLANSLSSVSFVFEALDITMYDISISGAAMAAELVELLGGIEEFGTKTQAFIQNFFSEDEQLEMAKKQVRSGMKAAGIGDSIIEGLFDGVGDAKKEFREFLGTLNLTTESGRKTYAAMMELSPAFALVSDGMDKAAEAMKEAAEAAIDLADASNQYWARIMNTRVSNSGDTLSIESSIDRAFNKYKLTDKYGITSAKDFATITGQDLLANYTEEQQGYITEILEGYAKLNDIAEDAAKSFREAAMAAIDAANASKQYWARVENARSPGLGDATSITANIEAAFNKYKQNDTYGILNAAQFLTITRDDFLKNYSNEQQGYITEIVEGYAKLQDLAVKEAEDAAEAARQAVEDAQNAAKERVDESLAGLARFIDIQKKIAQNQINNLQETVDSITRLTDMLNSNIKSLREAALGASRSTVTQASQFISTALDNALSNGVLPDSDLLSDAISTLTDDIGAGNFESLVEQNKARLVLANQLEQLESLGLLQKSEAERSIDLLEIQVTSLDLMLDIAQAQVDMLNGLDFSINGVSVATLEVSYKVAELREQMEEVGFDTTEGLFGVTSSIGNLLPALFGVEQGISDTQVRQISAVLSAGEGVTTNLGRLITELGIPLQNSGIPVVSAIQALQEALVYAIQTINLSVPTPIVTTPPITPTVPDFVIGPFTGPVIGAPTTPSFSIGPGTSPQTPSNPTGGSIWDIIFNPPAQAFYADGGAFTNGIVDSPSAFNIGVMGEAGPEAIVPLSRTSDGSLGIRATGSNNEALIAEIRVLKESNERVTRRLERALADISNHTEETKKLLDSVVRGGEVISTETTISSY